MHRYRIAFFTGLAAGFVVGARAGRERYEQLKKLARTAADNPAVQQAAGALQAQAAGLASTARQKVTSQLRDRVPGMARVAKRAADSQTPGRAKRDANGSVEEPGDEPFTQPSDSARPRDTGPS